MYYRRRVIEVPKVQMRDKVCSGYVPSKHFGEASVEQRRALLKAGKPTLHVSLFEAAKIKKAQRQ